MNGLNINHETNRILISRNDQLKRYGIDNLWLMMKNQKNRLNLLIHRSTKGKYQLTSPMCRICLTETTQRHQRTCPKSASFQVSLLFSWFRPGRKVKIVTSPLATLLNSRVRMPRSQPRNNQCHIKTLLSLLLK